MSMETQEEHEDRLRWFIKDRLGQKFDVNTRTIVDSGLADHPRLWTVLCGGCPPLDMTYPLSYEARRHVELEYALTLQDNTYPSTTYAILAGKCPACGTLHFAKARR